MVLKMEKSSRNVIDFMDKENIAFDHAWCEDNKIWCMGKTINYIFCMDTDTRRINIGVKIPDVPVMGYRDYHQVVKVGNKMVCLPSMAKEIIIYDFVQCSVKKIIADRSYEHEQITWCFAGRVEHKLYIISSPLKQIAVLDLQQDELEACYPIGCLYGDDKIGFQHVLYKNRLYIPVRNRSEMIVFDTVEHKFDHVQIEQDGEGYTRICRSDKSLWLIGEHYGIVKWDLNSGEWHKIDSFPEDFQIFESDLDSGEIEWHPYQGRGSECFFFSWETFCDGRYVWIVPHLSNSVICIEKNTDVIRRVEFADEDEETGSMGGRTDSYKFAFLGVEKGRYIRILSIKNSVVYCIDNETFTYCIERWEMDLEELQDLVKITWNMGQEEKRSMGLRTLIDYLLTSR